MNVDLLLLLLFSLSLSLDLKQKGEKEQRLYSSSSFSLSLSVFVRPFGKRALLGEEENTRVCCTYLQSVFSSDEKWKKLIPIRHKKGERNASDTD